MRGIGPAIIVLVVGAMQISEAHPVHAQGPADSTRSIGEALPLFEKNRCSSFREPADQLYCGDPELNAASVKLSAAIQDRLERIANRPLAIAENAEWIRDRNSSCGIFGTQSISYHSFKSIQSCLLKETEERIEILSDPNFDCLATNTTAGMLICSDPALALAKAEFNDHVLELVAKLKGDPQRIRTMGQRTRSQMRVGGQGQRAAGGAVVLHCLPGAIYQRKDRRAHWRKGRSEKDFRPPSSLALT